MSVNYIRFVTGLHFAKSELRALNSITFLFDPNWEFGNSEVPTFPIAFYHVTGIHEVMETEVSQKPMLFYNDPSVVSSNAVTGSIMNIVADNILIRPKQYKIDMIIPFQTLSAFAHSHILNPEQAAAVASLLLTGDVENAITNKITPYLTLSTPYIKIIKDILLSLVNMDFTGKDTMIQSILTVPDYNKNSLEQMWLSRSILKMKMWNTWRYKYVAITSLDISKEPTEQGVYRGSMTVQEIPILTMRPFDADLQQEKTIKNPVVEATGNAIKNFINGREAQGDAQ